MESYALAAGTLVILEGPDRTGKTTQRDALQRLLDPASTQVLHMPSGITPFAALTYDLLEDPARRPVNGLATQLAHLACHADNVPRLREALETGAVVLDRWWWSTFAYGWATGDIPSAGVTDASFSNLVESVWAGVDPAIVFLFEQQHEQDPNNSDLVLHGYRQLAQRFPEAVRVPRAEADEVTRFLLAELLARGLLTVRKG